MKIAPERREMNRDDEARDQSHVDRNAPELYEGQALVLIGCALGDRRFRTCMTHELFWLVMTIIMTGLLWFLHVDRVLVGGLEATSTTPGRTRSRSRRGRSG